MKNILIVDDEPLVLMTIRSLCCWEDCGIHITGEAANGRAALEFVRNNPGIDIVVIDVEMPVMNGIEFAEALRQENLNPSLIFLSSYSNFEYARSAFKSGGCEYILKSELDERSLLDIINRIPKQNLQRQGVVKQECLIEKKRMTFFDAILNNMSADADSLFNESAFTVDWPFYFLILRPGDLLMVHQRYENRLSDFQKTVTDLLGRFVPQYSGDTGSLSYDQYYIFMKGIQELDTAFEMFYQTAWTYIDIGFEKKTGGPAVNHADFKEQFSRCLAGFLPPSRFVIRSRRYIRERYNDPDLDLRTIAAYIGVSKNHLSFEFSHETGETISDFITKTRIKEAEKLLLQTGLKMYEIAEKTGYQNVETFTRAFKRITGKNPSRFM